MSDTDEKNNNIQIRVDASRKRESLPEFHQDFRCPHCGGQQETGFGLAGGGFGIYTFCPRCQEITSKSEVEE